VVDEVTVGEGVDEVRVEEGVDEVRVGVGCLMRSQCWGRGVNEVTEWGRGLMRSVGEGFDEIREWWG